jgi:hypothetical protein
VFFLLLFSSLFSRQCVNTKKRKLGLLWSYTPTSRRERQELFFFVCVAVLMMWTRSTPRWRL